MRLPPIEAMLRIWADADNSNDCAMTGNCSRTPGWAASSDIRTSAPTRNCDGCKSMCR